MVNATGWNIPDVPTFRLESPDFSEGDRLPNWARSEGAGGEDRSPTLHWEGAPSGTRSFAITVFDPDAGSGNGWWHWAVCNIPSKISSLAADAGNPEADLLPAGTVTLSNDSGQTRFGGAAPPRGHGEHRYVFTVFALDVERLELPDGSAPRALSSTISEHVIAMAQLTGRTETPANA